MYKSIIIVAVACTLAWVASAAPIHEADEVQVGMRDAFQRGLSRFGNGVDPSEVSQQPKEGAKERIFSHYTKGLRALGGGKPMIREQYRQHKYTPLAPSVLPKEFSVSEKMTPEEAANIYRPSRPLQYTTDILH